MANRPGEDLSHLFEILGDKRIKVNFRSRMFNGNAKAIKYLAAVILNKL